MLKRKPWVDLLRGICMLAILLDHTELYYTGINVINYNVYVVNALVLFFVLSGYLMYKEDGFDIRKKIKSIFRTLLLPYFLFSLLISIPKVLFYTHTLDFIDIFQHIVLGQASWFIAALSFAEIIFSILIWITHGKNYVLSTISGISFIFSIYLSTKNQPYIWQLDNSMQALLFLSMGYLYHQYEYLFRSISKISYLSFLAILLIIIKIYEFTNGVNMLIWPIHINHYPMFLIDIITCSLFMLQLTKIIPINKWTQWIVWTGRHSIVYYFLCGGIPLMISVFLEKINIHYDGNYLHVMVALLLVYCLTTLIAWGIYQYTPCIIGKKKGAIN